MIHLSVLHYNPLFTLTVRSTCVNNWDFFKIFLELELLKAIFLDSCVSQEPLPSCSTSINFTGDDAGVECTKEFVFLRNLFFNEK